jgi:hypothetical protein
LFSYFPGPPDNCNHKVAPITFFLHTLLLTFAKKACNNLISVVARTIVNGLCYLATFIFGINSFGLFLYSGQLAINSLMEGSTNEENKSKGDDQQLGSPNSTAESATDSSEVSSSSSKADQSPNDAQ